MEIGNVWGVVDPKSPAYAELGTFGALIAKKSVVEINILRVELFLGVFIGAITFTGSIIAYGKLAGKFTSAATKLPGGHFLNGAAALSFHLPDLVFQYWRVFPSLFDDTCSLLHRLSPYYGDWRC